jgi:small subunit ribosomal protein S1
VKGKVCRAAPFGVFVELLPGVEGLCHRSEIAEDAGKRRTREPVADESPLPVGEEFEFKVIKMNEAQKRIGLSLRAITEEDEQNRLRDYNRQALSTTATVGDAIKQHKAEEQS